MYVFHMFQFYTSLLYLKQIETGKAKDHVKEIRQFRKHSQRFSKMGSFNPNNFEGNIALLEAEYARCKGYHDLAVKAYSKAIRLMEEKEYDHESAITYELAARYYRSIEETNISTLYLTKAHEKWLAWGAVVKAEQLVNEFPELSSQSYTPNQYQGQSIDLNTVIQASTAISEQIVQEKLLSTLMSILLKNAGAQKGMLFELEGDQWGLLTWGDIEQGIRVLDSSSTRRDKFSP